MTLLQDTLGMTLLQDTLVRHSWYDTFVGNSCKTLLLDTLSTILLKGAVKYDTLVGQSG